MNQSLVQIKRALISVFDKTGIVEFAQELDKMGVEILSSGGTFKKLKEAKIKVKEVSDYTGFPEMMDGRVKTLHPKIHGGILALRDNKEHQVVAKSQGIEFIDLVVVNLYPFSQVIKKSGVSLDEVIENIDIGGPTMVRAAAKNCGWVGVVVDPADYAEVLAELKTKGGLSYELREQLMQRAFAHTALYDSTIYNYLSAGGRWPVTDSKFPAQLNLNYQKFYDCRYGENPHQAAAAYKEIDNSGCNVINAKILHGKELSFNNIVDADRTLNIVKEFIEPVAVVVKHGNPCGVSVHQNIDIAFQQAYDADSKSAFGGVIALNRPLTKKIAEAINKVFAEIVMAPSYEAGALEILQQKKNIRILELGEIKSEKIGLNLRQVEGGMLIQDYDTYHLKKEDLKVVTENQPTKAQIEEILFNWQVMKNMNSNAILISQNKTTLGVGCGQVSRVDSVEIAIKKAGDKVKGSVLCSDSFFPFPDSIELIAKAGVAVIAQQGGSINDETVIKAADEQGLVMVFTGIRAFKH
ncbi:MAG: bifunctional phosphoribosylaminoimidazolecarboxamide formyltransferase/IMP cyclohydrolase [Patescibacteria group bacterium]